MRPGANAAVRRRRRLLLVGLCLTAAVLLAVVVAQPGTALRTRGAGIAHFTIKSRFVRRAMPVAIVVPAGGGSGRPLLVFLHGRGANQDSELSDQLFRALSALGRRAPDIVFPYGGDHSYWHDRADGAWAEYVLREVIPDAVKRVQADPTRIAIGGISMGGFGAYDLARLAPARFCAVGGHSAALWTSAADAAPGAFDNATDFARNDVIGFVRAHPTLYGHARVWLDGGDRDPFHTADQVLARVLGTRLHVWPGGHDSAYWNAHWGTYLRFYATALATCKPRSPPPA
jgi:S-formylglutathione hydrolase FrmB